MRCLPPLRRGCRRAGQVADAGSGEGLGVIHFEWQEILYLIPLPLLLRYLLPPVRRHQEAALKVPFYQDLLSFGGVSRRVGEQSWAMFLLLLLTWTLLVVAAARPQWLGEPVVLPASGRDLMLAVDTSGSMEMTDMSLNSRPVDRLTVVKSVAGDFIERRVGDRVGLILFGDQAYLQTPLTFDRETTNYMLNEAAIGLAGQKTAIGDGIGLAVKRLRERPQDSRVLILLTDGANTAGEVDPRQAAKLAAKVGVKIYTIGVGADEVRVQGFFGSRTINPSADLDEETLKYIAETTGGAYFRARDTQSLEQIYARIDQLEPAITETETFRPVQPLFFYPLALALLLSGLIAWRQCGISLLSRRWG